MNRLHDDDWVDDQVRAAFDAVSLPPHRLHALVAEAEGRGGAAGFRWLPLLTGGLVLLAAVLAMALIVGPWGRPDPGVPPRMLAPEVRPAAPAPVAPVPEPRRELLPRQLEPAPEPVPVPPGELRIRSTSRALIYVGDEIAGYTPLVLEVDPGHHVIRALEPGRPQGEQRREVEIEPGGTLQLDFTFDARRPSPVPAPRVPAPAPPAIEVLGLWIGSVKPGDRSIKLTIHTQGPDGFEGAADLQTDDGTFRSFRITGTVDGSGRLTFGGPSARFDGRVDQSGKRATGRGTVDGRAITWSLIGD